MKVTKLKPDLENKLKRLRESRKTMMGKRPKWKPDVYPKFWNKWHKWNG